MLLFSLGVDVSVGLSVACNIHIGENERGRCVSDVSTVYALVFFSIFRQKVSQITPLFPFPKVELSQWY